LKGKGENAVPKAWVFETGTNVWRKFDTWPPKVGATASTLHLWNGGKLSELPDISRDAVDSVKPPPNFDEFISDPAKPVPFIGKTTISMSREYMTADQRFAGNRTDVLVYQTPVLKEDTTIAGSIGVELYVSTTGTDADFVVKLIDVYPDDFPNPKSNPTEVEMGGYQQLVRGEPFRGKFRNSFEKPEPFKPGEGREDQVLDARHAAHVPPRPPHHGAGAEFVVPAGGPQPADLHEHLHGGGRGLQEADASHIPRRKASIECDGAGVKVMDVRFELTSRSLE